MRVAGSSLHVAWLAALAAPVGDGAPPRRVDSPLFRISSEELPIKTPTPIEAQEDERERPYHALVRLWRFPALEPLDVPLERIEVRGAACSSRVAPGEYLFSDVSLGYTAAVVFADPTAAPPSPTPGRGRPTLAGRNPLVLARHAITVCDLYVADEAALDGTTALAGRVVDRAERRPLADATVRCGEASASTDSEGRFAFAAPVSWRSLLQSTVIGKDGWRPIAMNARTMTRSTVERLLRDHEIEFALPRDGGEPPSTLLPPLLR